MGPQANRPWALDLPQVEGFDVSFDAHNRAQNFATVWPQALVHHLHGVLGEREMGSLARLILTPQGLQRPSNKTQQKPLGQGFSGTRETDRQRQRARTQEMVLMSAAALVLWGRPRGRPSPTGPIGAPQGR